VVNFQARTLMQKGFTVLEWTGTQYRLYQKGHKPQMQILTPDEGQKYHNHSPDGFNHGYSGSGPAQLAISVMIAVYGKPVIGSYHYQHLKDAVIAKMPQDQPCIAAWQWIVPLYGGLAGIKELEIHLIEKS
jgi:hypothetical protein